MGMGAGAGVASKWRPYPTVVAFVVEGAGADAIRWRP